MRLGIVLILLALVRIEAWADVEVYWQADTTQVTLGEPVALRLVSVYSSDLTIDEPDLTSHLAAASFRGTDRLGPEVDGSMARLELSGTVRFFELGAQEIPRLNVVFIEGNGDTLNAQVRPLVIEVIGTRETGDDDLRDIKPPVAIRGGIPLWLVLLVAGIILLLLIALVVYWIRRRRRASDGDVVQPDPVDYAAEFQRIASMGLIERGEFKTYYSLLADNLRRFMEESLVAEAMEKTTSELEVALRAQDMPSEVIRQVTGYLSTADLVKFARFHPEIDSARRMPESGLGILRELQKQQRLRAAAHESSEEGHAESAL